MIKKYLHIKLLDSIEKEPIILRINESKLKIAPTPGKWFTNIDVQEDVEVEVVSGDADGIVLEISDKKIFHPDQEKFDKKYSINHHELLGAEVFYSVMGNLINPDFILVTFPGVSNFDNVNYRLSALTSIQHKLSKNTLIIAFQDKEAVYGNYMYKSSSGDFLKPVVISLIKGLAVKYKIKENKIIFYGNSKGGSIAIDYIDNFLESSFFIDIPQLDLFNYKSQNDLMRYSLGVEAREYNFFKNSFPNIQRRNVFYSFAENDFDASRGLPMKDFSTIPTNMLKDMGHSNAAMEFVKRQFSKIFQIINKSDVNLRPIIGAKAYVKDNLLYINRYLSAFNTEDLCKSIYAEINFSNELNTYSVSLNKKFIDQKTFVYWRNGFDFRKHLKNDIYQIHLTVYSKFKEIRYPLDIRLVIDEENAFFEKLSTLISV